MNYNADLFMHFMILANLTMALSIPFRWGSRLVLCQGLFVGFGSYCVTILVNRFGVPVYLAIFMGTVGGALIGWLLANITFRLDNATFAIITFIIGLSSMELFKNLHSITGGSTGLKRMGLPSLFGETSPKTITALLLAVSCIGFYLLYSALLKSQFGRTVLALRDDSVGAILDGISTKHTELRVLALFGGHTALIGTLWAFGLPRIAPEYFSFWFLSLQVILACIIVAGISPGSMLIGALVVIFVDESTQKIPVSPQMKGQVPLLIVGIIYVVVTLVGDYSTMVKTIKRTISKMHDRWFGQQQGKGA